VAAVKLLKHSPIASFLGGLAIAVGLTQSIGVYDDDSAFWSDFPEAMYCTVAGAAVLLLGIWLRRLAHGAIWQYLGPLALVLTGLGPLLLPSAELQQGVLAPGVWLVTLGVAFFAWEIMQHVANLPQDRLRNILVPALFGLTLLYFWQAITVGFMVPKVLLPAPSDIALALLRSADTLVGDFQQTFMKAVIAGFVIGNALGILVALLVDRSPFLQRGLLPLGNFISAVPVIGVAPIMVMWFGFGWESKTAVIVFMIFFPMLINALAGLAAADRMLQDLMRSYGAGYWATLFKLRLPVALPFLFNAFKINSTLALIGAIVAEFFGSPTAGLGFRISVEVGRMNVDVVWATIAVAALAGSLSYGLLAVLERSLTFWHPSYRS
jgi:NitT/TauT family transport system permease protein